MGMSITTHDKVEVGVRVSMNTPQHIPQTSSLLSSSALLLNENEKDKERKQPSRIVLKGKLGLPEGFGPLKPYQKLRAKLDLENGSNNGSVTSGSINGSVVDKDEEEGGSIVLTSAALARLALTNKKLEKKEKSNLKYKLKFKGSRLGRVNEGQEGTDEEDVDNMNEIDDNNFNDDENDEDSESDDSDDDNEIETVNTTASLQRLRGETPEQRKIRKNLVSKDCVIIIFFNLFLL